MLNQNPIGDEGMAAMAAALGGGGTKLRSVAFNGVAVSDDGVKELAAALAKGAAPRTGAAVIIITRTAHSEALTVRGTGYDVDCTTAARGRP